MTDKPVMEIDDNGDKYWWLDGNLHREDGPAIEYNDGDKEWWLDGNLHREDGPAYERADGSKHWYLNGEWVTKEEHKNLTSDKDKEKSEYTRVDLIRSAEEMYPDCYAKQAGNLRATLNSVLLHVEVHNPEMFQEIIQFEMRCQERMKEIDTIVESPYT